MKCSAPLYRETTTLRKQWTECEHFSSLPWARDSLSLFSRVGTAHIWITESFLPGAILDCYSLEASHAVTGTNWFNHQLLWSLKLLKVPAKLMNCNWMWNECLSLFPTTSYQRLLYPCKVKGRGSGCCSTMGSVKGQSPIHRSTPNYSLLSIPYCMKFASN